MFRKKGKRHSKGGCTTEQLLLLDFFILPCLLYHYLYCTLKENRNSTTRFSGFLVSFRRTLRQQVDGILGIRFRYSWSL